MKLKLIDAGFYSDFLKLNLHQALKEIEIQKNDIMAAVYLANSFIAQFNIARKFHKSYSILEITLALKWHLAHLIYDTDLKIINKKFVINKALNFITYA